MPRSSRPAKSRRQPAETAPARPRGDARAAAAAPALPVAAAPAAVLWRWLVPLACALVTLAVFWPVLDNQFVDWDDDINFVNNPEFRGLGWANLRFMLTTTMMGHWMPTTWITFGVDYLLWGMNPRGYHLTNLLLHVAAAVAVYFVSLRLLRATMAGGEQALRLGALAAALFFAIHPLRVESVAWVTERRDVLSGFWFVLTVLTYLKAADTTGARRRWWLAGSVGAYALAATSKAIVMTLPAVLVLLDIYPLGRLGTRWREWAAPTVRPVWLEKIPYVMLAVGTAVMAIHVQRSFAENLVMQPLEFRVAVALYGLFFYVWKTLAPWPISPLYQLPLRLDPLAPSMLAAAAAVIGVSAAFLWLRRRWPAGLAVWLSYLLLLAPVSGLTQSGPQLVAARYSYLACLGFALLAGAAVVLLARRGRSDGPRRVWARAGGVAAVASLAALGALSWHQAQIWRDSETLWSYVVAIEPTSAIGHNNLGHSYLQQGRLDEAEREIMTSLRLSPEWDQAHTNLAALLARQGRMKEAGEARARLGYLLLAQGKHHAAVELFRREVASRPDDAAAHNNLGAALLLRGDVGSAIDQFEHALRINPDHDRARRNLAAARQRQ
jgi:Flp pilus assembly protein TadD